MIDDVLVAVPIKPFTVAKARLAPHLDAASRRRLGMTTAARTVRTARGCVARVAVVTGDRGVAGWARALGVDVIDEDDPSLDGAADAAARTAHQAGLRWAILHADLPLLTESALRRTLAHEGPVIAPSHDAGTTLLVGSDAVFPFSYGPGSFTRHLASLAPCTVVVDPVFALDLDTPADLRHIAGLPEGAWLRDLVAAGAHR